jgi:hypothetical protein
MGLGFGNRGLKHFLNWYFNKNLCITSFNNLRNALLMRNVNWEMQQWQRIKSKTSTSLSKAFASKAASRNLSIDNN